MQTDRRITLDHGAGGTAMRRLIDETIIARVSNTTISQLVDSAVLAFNRQTLAFTTDSYVIQPLFFPGGDIGKLAVCGTVNDLLVVGARPAYLSLGLILEEGLPFDVLERVLNSVAETARRARVEIVTGDTKVVPRGTCDQMFINTSGIGELPLGHGLSPDPIQVGDSIIVSGTIGEHALAILGARDDGEFKHEIFSDCTPLVEMIESVLIKHDGVKWMRDATRGGVAAVLDELSLVGPFQLEVDESRIPALASTHSLCELMGFDPLHLANEGKIVLAVAASQAEAVLATLKEHTDGRNAALLGEIIAQCSASVHLRTPGGGLRRLRRPTGELLPRIC